MSGKNDIKIEHINSVYDNIEKSGDEIKLRLFLIHEDKRNPEICYQEISSILNNLPRKYYTRNKNKPKRIPYRVYFDWLWDNFSASPNITMGLLADKANAEFNTGLKRYDNLTDNITYHNHFCNIMKKFSRILSEDSNNHIKPLQVESVINNEFHELILK